MDNFLRKSCIFYETTLEDLGEYEYKTYEERSIVLKFLASFKDINEENYQAIDLIKKRIEEIKKEKLNGEEVKSVRKSVQGVLIGSSKKGKKTVSRKNRRKNKKKTATFLETLDPEDRLKNEIRVIVALWRQYSGKYRRKIKDITKETIFNKFSKQKILYQNNKEHAEKYEERIAYNIKKFLKKFNIKNYKEFEEFLKKKERFI